MKVKLGITFFLILCSTIVLAQQTSANSKEQKSQESLADKVCASGYIKWGSSNPVSGFEKSILEQDCGKRGRELKD